MQKGLRVITLQGAIEKSPISQLEKLMIGWHHNYFVYFGGSNNIFVDCILLS